MRFPPPSPLSWPPQVEFGDGLDCSKTSDEDGGIKAGVCAGRAEAAEQRALFGRSAKIAEYSPVSFAPGGGDRRGCPVPAMIELSVDAHKGGAHKLFASANTEGGPLAGLLAHAGVQLIDRTGETGGLTKSTANCGKSGFTTSTPTTAAPSPTTSTSTSSTEAPPAVGKTCGEKKDKSEALLSEEEVMKAMVEEVLSPGGGLSGDNPQFLKAMMEEITEKMGVDKQAPLLDKIQHFLGSPGALGFCEQAQDSVGVAKLMHQFQDMLVEAAPALRAAAGGKKAATERGGRSAGAPPSPTEGDEGEQDHLRNSDDPQYNFEEIGEIFVEELAAKFGVDEKTVLQQFLSSAWVETGVPGETASEGSSSEATPAGFSPKRATAALVAMISAATIGPKPATQTATPKKKLAPSSRGARENDELVPKNTIIPSERKKAAPGTSCLPTAAAPVPSGTTAAAPGTPGSCIKNRRSSKTPRASKTPVGQLAAAAPRAAPATPKVAARGAAVGSCSSTVQQLQQAFGLLQTVDSHHAGNKFKLSFTPAIFNLYMGILLPEIVSKYPDLTDCSSLPKFGEVFFTEQKLLAFLAQSNAATFFLLWLDALQNQTEAEKTKFKRECQCICAVLQNILIQILGIAGMEILVDSCHEDFTKVARAMGEAGGAMSTLMEGVGGTNNSGDKARKEVVEWLARGERWFLERENWMCGGENSNLAKIDYLELVKFVQDTDPVRVIRPSQPHRLYGTHKADRDEQEFLTQMTQDSPKRFQTLLGLVALRATLLDDCAVSPRLLLLTVSEAVAFTALHNFKVFIALWIQQTLDGTNGHPPLIPPMGETLLKLTRTKGGSGSVGGTLAMPPVDAGLFATLPSDVVCRMLTWFWLTETVKLDIRFKSLEQKDSFCRLVRIGDKESREPLSMSRPALCSGGHPLPLSPAAAFALSSVKFGFGEVVADSVAVLPPDWNGPVLSQDHSSLEAGHAPRSGRSAGDLPQNTASTSVVPASACSAPQKGLSRLFQRVLASHPALSKVDLQNIDSAIASLEEVDEDVGPVAAPTMPAHIILDETREEKVGKRYPLIDRM